MPNIMEDLKFKEERMAGASPRITFLLIADSFGLRESVKFSLREALPQVLVREAKDGAQVISELIHQSIDLIFLDWETSWLDGRAFLRMIQSDSRFAGKPVGILVDRLTPELLREFHGHQSVWFMEKPVEAVELAEVARRFLDSTI
ncbi:MAG: response regulator [bacterium]